MVDLPFINLTKMKVCFPELIPTQFTVSVSHRDDVREMGTVGAEQQLPPSVPKSGAGHGALL